MADPVKNLDVIILAGGLGTRLKLVSADLPKILVPVVGRPFITHVFDHLISQKITRVILAVGYKYDAVMTQLGASYKSLQIAYCIEDKPLGTGGAIMQALQQAQSDHVIVMNGDSLYTVDFEKLRQKSITLKADVTLALKPMRSFDRYGTVQLTGDTVTAFHEKQPCHEGLISGGTYCVHRDLYDEIFLPEKHSWERDVLEKNLHALKIVGDIQDVYFIDIGIPEDYQKAQKDLT